MELENKYENLLVEIHDSKNERFTKSEILQRRQAEKKELHDLIEYLISIELVEFDKKDNAYYLTYEGYEKVEDIKKNIENENLEKEYPKLKERRNKFKIILLLLFLFISGFLAFNGIKVNNSLKHGLDEEALKKIKSEIETKTDSILKAKELNK